MNFITAHDGFTLYDMVAYNDKHNEANGENNNDGANDNNSWNCGWEGPTDDPGINALRRRQIKNATTLLMVSQGVPMILMGDEVARTQQGNNNTYCHDNELNWFDWTRLESNADVLRFFQHGDRVPPRAFGPTQPLAFQQPRLCGQRLRGYLVARRPGVAAPIGAKPAASWRLCCAASTPRTAPRAITISTWRSTCIWDALPFELPRLTSGMRWHMGINTSMESPEDVFPFGEEPVLGDQGHVLAGGRSVVVLVGK